MSTRLALLAVAILATCGQLHSEEEKKARKTFQVPFKTTIPKHIVVRVKINGKGPFNFILDTGAPAMFIAEKVGKKCGLANGDDGWAIMDRLEFEGGPVLLKAPARVETPFQLEGMNGLGMAGMEVHGMIGYSILAAYRMEIDLSKDKMTWEEVGSFIPLPKRAGKGGGVPAGLEVLGTLMKSLGSMLGRKPNVEVTLRGFHGLTLENGDEHPRVTAVLDGGPAAKAGIRPGDQVVKVGGRTVVSVGDVLRFAARHAPRSEVAFTIKRGDEVKEVKLTSGEGI
jgi:hypothetical protein